jgi:hypothetical protein
MAKHAPRVSTRENASPWKQLWKTNNNDGDKPSLHFSYVSDTKLRDELRWPMIIDFGLAIGVEF